jgi:hypothetical protein
MKKWTVYLMVLAMITIGSPLFGANYIFPDVPHTGSIGYKAGQIAWPWAYMATDYFRLYGTQKTYYFNFTGTPTATRTITIPDTTGSMAVNSAVSKSYVDTSGNTTLTAAESYASYFTAGGTLSHYSTGAMTLTAAACSAGKIVTVYNSDASNNLTLKVTGQSGFAVAAGKIAMGVCTGTDFKAATADK